MKSTKMMIAAAAMSGLLAGAAAHVSASALTGSQIKASAVSVQAGAKSGAIALDKHDCKGMNTCKGQGGCSAGDNGCKGKNTCKGKGGCKTESIALRTQAGAKGGAIALDKHDCKGMNTCKGQGGCSAGDNGCKGKNTCKGKGGCKTDSL